MKLTTKIGLTLGTVLALLTGSTMFALAEPLTRQLQMGMSGSDVGTLQVFLAKDASIYPEAKVTNYYWTLTRNAVMRFQAQNGIATVGRVGPQTLEAINLQMSGNMGTVIPSANGVRPVSVTSIRNNNNGTVSIDWTTPRASNGVVYYSTSPLSAYENDNSVTISGNTISANNFQLSQSVQIPNVQSGVTYYYAIYTSDQNGNVNMTWPATFRNN